MLIILIIIAILAVVFVLPKLEKKHLPVLIMLVVVILTVTGRIHWIALAGSVLPFLFTLYRWHIKESDQKNTRIQESLATLDIKKSNPTKKDIKDAYKKKATQHHPDKGGDEKEFNRIKDAHDFLINNIKSP